MEFITDNFELLTKTADSIDQHKQLVLDLAVRGLLVPQVEEEGNASVIIQQSKELLTRKNTSRKKKSSPPFLDDELPFEIPSNWAWARLGDVFRTTSGGTPTRGVPEYWNGEIPWLKSGELNDSIITNSPSEYITEEGLKNSSAKLFPKGSLVIALYGATAGKLGILDYETTSNQAVCAFFENPYISTEYLFFYLLAYRSKIVKDSWGQAQPNISQTYLKKFPFALPPIEEQNRIVQKVNTLFAQIDELAATSERSTTTRERLRRVWLHRLEQAPDRAATERAWLPLQDHFDLAIQTVEDVQALRQTILQLAVKGQLVPQDPNEEPASVLLARIQEEKDRLVKTGEIRKPKKLPPVSEEEVPFAVPAGWVWCRLEAISIILMGQSPKGSSYNSEGVGVSLINGPVEFGKGPFEKTILSKWTTEPTKMCVEGDLLVCVRGATTGRTNIAGFDACIGRGVAAIRPMIIEKFLHYFMLNSRYRILALGTGTTFPSISQDDLKSLLFPLPPLNEQKRIVEKLEEFFKRCDDLQTMKRELGKKESILMKSVVSKSYQV